MQPDLSSKGRAVPLAAIIFSATSGDSIPAGYVGLWSDGTTLFKRDKDGRDTPQGASTTAPLFVAITKTSAALPACTYEYLRRGALNLLAALDTRTGQVLGICRRRKRQVEFIELLELIDQRTPPHKRRIHLVCDNVSTHHGKLVRAWLAKHPRFQLHFPPVHCSWMNQIEQWFSILQRKRLKHADFVDLDALEHKILAFIAEWNQVAAPFQWTKKSFEKVLAKVDAEIKRAA